jgi:hypothetical protein
LGFSSPSDISLKLRIEKEFAPKVVKLELMEDSNASMAVSIPIKAVRPIAIIVIVIILLNLFA